MDGLPNRPGEYFQTGSTFCVFAEFIFQSERR